MSLLAQGGWFFNEWYWEPIFRTLKVLPLLGIVALVTAIVARGWIPSLGHRVWVAMGIIAGGTALTLGLGLYGAYERPARESRTVASTLGFTAYEPRPLPPSFVLDHARAGVGPADAPVLYLRYAAGGGLVDVTQEPRPAPGAEWAAGRCLLPEVRCREVRTPKGRTVLVERTVRGSTNASAFLGGTLVSVLAVDVGRDAVLDYYDALQPVDATKIEFSRA